MLLLFNADATALSDVRRGGLRATGEPLTLWTSLDAVPDDAETILVIDTSRMNGTPVEADADRVRMEHVPAHAIRNLDPYCPPASVLAGGGYVVQPCEDDDELALLMIYRRGRWDIPKGKIEEGETIRECAVREVKEEVGARTMRIIRPLGPTQHGFEADGRYWIKTTHWYLMQTDDEHFDPATNEGIYRIAWATWPVARRHVGYDTLSVHMDQVEADVRAAFRDTPKDSSHPSSVA